MCKVKTVITRAVKGLSGLQHSGASHKPKGILFFAGPTGVGKTETAKALAESLFGDENACIRFDMSEYRLEHSDQKLFGAPPGYVGYEGGGQLTNAIKNRPFSVILFDEIEKASPTILDKFLQILEDGRMTDNQGNTVYFGESVIIFTSNIGLTKEDDSPQYALRRIPHRVPTIEIENPEIEDSQEFRNKVTTMLTEGVKSYFIDNGRPELLNRLGEDNIVVFQFINKHDAEKICDSKLKKICKSIKEEKNINIIYDDVVSLLHKKAVLERKNGGRGVVFATGTPITNSVTDAYVMQSYLQSGELALLGLSSFDSWVGMFAEKSTDFEVDVDTTNFRMATRFAKFHNLPELTSILASIADFHAVDKTGGLPDFNGYTDSVVSPTPAFKDYLKEISSRADDVRSRRVPPDVDNMLKITNHGRLAALDLRLVDNTARFTYQSKVARCAERIIDTYGASNATKSAQLVFCDTSTPKPGFNMYDELKRLLVFSGIPAEEIAFVHDGTTDKKRDALFQDVRDGKVRVLIGSTAKLGMGVNVQERLIAIHHLDVPWRPADMVQREGRILRQGNTSQKIYIFRYVTDGSFDAYSWQLLESKARFIAQLLGGSMKMHSGTDVGAAGLN